MKVITWYHVRWSFFLAFFVGLHLISPPHAHAIVPEHRCSVCERKEQVS